jgi:peptidoglycan/xylan/chitin deacetylase (PgdA/CDA1 family)
MRIPILMYHQIDVPPPSGTPLRGLVVSPNSFARQMRLLKWLGYKGLSMHDLEPYLDGRQAGKVVGITFDDGYQNNLTHALPTLTKYGFTSTCYAVSDMFGGVNSWDHNIGVAQKQLMTRDNWRSWLAAGMEVGSHTKTHADLEKLSDFDAFNQIADSKQQLENLLNCEVRHFCYPYGRFNKSHSQMTKQAGYVSATTTHRGRVQMGDDLFTLKRVLVAQATNSIQFSLKVCTNYEDRRG